MSEVAATPDLAGPEPARGPDVNEMFVIHRVFRRELTQLPTLIRRVADGDRRRARVVGGHVRLVLAGLHMHHVGEDEVLWPRLSERAAPSAGLVSTMQEQHAAVELRAGLLDHLLDGDAVALPLPADEVGPVIGDQEGVARHGPKS